MATAETTMNYPTDLRRVGGHSDWMEHVRERWAEALCVLPLRADATIAENEAMVFLPSEVVLHDICPSQSLAGLSDKKREAIGGWSKRLDLFEVAAEWLKDQFSTDESATIICLAGYSRLGDKSLGNKRHFEFKGQPILVAPIHSTSVEDIATTLRWGRSWQLLGAVVRGDLSILKKVPNVLFICDALDGDSIVLVPLK